MANKIDYSQLSMLEAAKEIVKDSDAPVAIKDLIAKVLELKNIDDNGDKATQLYVDITTSADFVYMGDNTWDLKDRQSLEEWDKDASAFNKDMEVEDEDDNGVSAKDYNTEDEESTNSDEDEENDEESIDEYDEEDEKNPYADDDDMESSDEDESEFDDIRDNPDEDEFDEDKYGDIMDSYEDLYDK